jgi:hypothetical protein
MYRNTLICVTPRMVVFFRLRRPVGAVFYRRGRPAGVRQHLGKPRVDWLATLAFGWTTGGSASIHGRKTPLETPILRKGSRRPRVQSRFDRNVHSWPKRLTGQDWTFSDRGLRPCYKRSSSAVRSLAATPPQCPEGREASSCNAFLFSASRIPASAPYCTSISACSN